MTRRVLVGMLISLAFLMGTQAEMRGGDRPSGAHSGETAVLFYLFSPAVPDQVRQVRLLREAVSWNPGLRMVGVIQESGTGDGIEEAVESIDLRPERTFSLVRLEEIQLQADPCLPRAVVGRGADGDYAVLVDGAGNLLREGTGRELYRFLASFSPGPISTDVDDSTWGKIKELFQ